MRANNGFPILRYFELLHHYCNNLHFKWYSFILSIYREISSRYTNRFSSQLSLFQHNGEYDRKVKVFVKFYIKHLSGKKNILFIHFSLFSSENLFSLYSFLIESFYHV